MKKLRVLMTGAGAPGGPGIIKCLQADDSIALYVCDASDTASGRFLNKEFFTCPSASDPGFIEFMLGKCQVLGIEVLFPLVTRELFLFAEHKSAFEKIGTRVVVSDFEALNIANDKSALHKHIAAHSILTPDFRIVQTFDQLDRAFTDLGYPDRKICIKPSISNGSRGVRIVDPNADGYDLLFNHKPNSLYITKDDLFRILSSRAFPELLVAEVLPGEEYTIDTLVNQGQTRLIAPRIRTRMSGGISVAGEFIENQEIIDYVSQIAATMPLHGPIGYQVKRAVDGRFKILEINPRIQGTSVALTGAGVNLPLLAVLQEAGRDITIPAIKWGTKFVRFYEEVYY
ncbi:MAG: ATP-grasp protein [Bacteroidetes bacterium]|nr:ATP-grasp protein [Bacteroidota bacterium]